MEGEGKGRRFIEGIGRTAEKREGRQGRKGGAEDGDASKEREGRTRGEYHYEDMSDKNMSIVRR